jgi:hypothetical protein
MPHRIFICQSGFSFDFSPVSQNTRTNTQEFAVHPNHSNVLEHLENKHCEFLIPTSSFTFQKLSWYIHKHSKATVAKTFIFRNRSSMQIIAAKSLAFAV